MRQHPETLSTMLGTRTCSVSGRPSRMADLLSCTQARTRIFAEGRSKDLDKDPALRKLPGQQGT